MCVRCINRAGGERENLLRKNKRKEKLRMKPIGRQYIRNLCSICQRSLRDIFGFLFFRYRDHHQLSESNYKITLFHLEEETKKQKIEITKFKSAQATISTYAKEKYREKIKQNCKFIRSIRFEVHVLCTLYDATLFLLLLFFLSVSLS